MTNTTETQPDFSAGRCPDMGDGDTGTRARSAIRGMEAYSINNANSPPDGGNLPVRTPPTSEHEPTADANLAGTATRDGGRGGEGSGDGPRGTRPRPVDEGPEPRPRESQSTQRTQPRWGAPPENEDEEGEEALPDEQERDPESVDTQADTEEEDDQSSDDGAESWDYEADEDRLFEEIRQAATERGQNRTGNATCKKNTRAALKIASLNMRGHGDVSHLDNMSAPNKWFHVNQMLRDQKIGVLALQETHMTDELCEAIERTFKRIRILHCSDPEAPNSKGVAIVLNKDITNASDAKSTPLIPGRAMSVSIPWHSEETIHILAIYAPNQANESKHFWNDLKRIHRQKKTHKPDIMLGDFNVVEDAIDRLPSHPDDQATVTALRALKHGMGLIDGWRCINQATKAYTYTSRSNGAHSRIDRIYASPKIIRNSANWLADTPGAFDTDHRMVSVQVVNDKAPFIGKGRYAIPAQMCKDKKFMRETLKLAKDLESDCLETESARGTPQHQTKQMLLKKFTEDIVEYAKKRSKEMTPRIDAKIKALEEQLEATVNDERIPQGERASTATELTENIARLAGERHRATRTAAAASNHMEGEVISKYWSGINVKRAPRDIVTKLRNPAFGDDATASEFITTSNGMAELTKDYHEDLQKEGDVEAGSKAEREAAFTPVLEKVGSGLSPKDKSEMAKYISEDLVSQAIREAANGKAAGMSGVPSEIWKQLSFVYEMSKETDSPSCNIAKVLATIYREIEEHGVQPGTDFSLGWLCPIFKKKDRYCVENYRPITVLNSEYKLFTKALSIRLSKVVGSIVHEDQAGFIKGRSIFNQIKLAKLIIPFAEASKQGGALVALDQEKAYDKIAHDYLWATMHKFNVPEHFIRTVRHLYTGAETLVIINGVLSGRYTVTRGVRQGDPLSCLLFDIAIEPLACMLRSSHLKGLQVTGCTERVLASLFADDTSVILGPGDKYEDLQKILTVWTKASRGKFNIPKTVIIPIGTTEYRREVRETRKLNKDHSPISDNIHIAEEGEPVRLLGAWIGNGVNSADPWGPVLEKVEKNLERWAKGHPTLEGRRLIVQMVVAGMTQYLTKVQGMPADVEKELSKRVQAYVWDGKRPTVNATVMAGPLGEGGKKILDIKARNEAIQLTWLQTYLAIGNDRPKWAYVADELIRNNLPKQKANVEPSAAILCLLQSWSPKATEGMPSELLEMMKIARKYDTSFDSPTVGLEVKRQMPIWYHRGATEKLGQLNNRPMAHCLRKSHGVRTVGDAMDMIEMRPTAHRNRRACACELCTKARALKCPYPHHCMEFCRDLIATLKPKWDPQAEDQQDGLERPGDESSSESQSDSEDSVPIRFNPTVRLRRKLADGFRVFAKKDSTMNMPAYRQPGNGAPTSAVVTVAGTETGRRDDDIRNGGGAFFGPEDARNLCIRVNGDKAGGTERAILTVIAKLAKDTSLSCALTIRLSSSRIIKALTKRLTKLEDQDMLGMCEGDELQAAAAALRRRGSEIWLQIVTQAGSDQGHREAQKLAEIGTRIVEPESEALRVPVRFSVTGLRLSRASQSLLYRSVLRRRKAMPRKATAMQVDIARWGAKSITGNMPTEEQIWRAIRKPIFLRPERTFLFMNMHSAYKIGDYWTRIPDYERRGVCPVCEEVESMEHILTQCEAPGRQLVWSLARKLFEMKTTRKWPGTGYGILMGNCAADLVDPAGKEDGLNRFYTILMITSMQFIWNLRCERRISKGDDPEKWHSEDEIHNRWVAKMNYRISMDQALTSEMRFEKKALSRTLVAETWKGTLDNEQSLPADWIRQSGVLVGIRPRRPPGRNR
jgi:exonuclease III